MDFYSPLLCVATAKRLLSIIEIYRRCISWSVPISPPSVTVPRFTVSVREWLLPTAVRFWPAVVQRAARFCPPKSQSAWVLHAEETLKSETGATAGWMWDSPRSLFNLANSENALSLPAGSFTATRRFVSLEIHKVFLRLTTLVCVKISRRSTDNSFLRVCLVMISFCGYLFLRKRCYEVFQFFEA